MLRRTCPAWEARQGAPRWDWDDKLVGGAWQARQRVPLQALELSEQSLHKAVSEIYREMQLGKFYNQRNFR